MENVSKNIKIPAIIALVLQANTVLCELIVMLFQKKFISLFYSYNFSSDVKTFPPGLILSAMAMVIHIVFVWMIYNYTGEKRRVAGIVLMALMLGIMATSYPVNYFYNIYVGRVRGTEYIAASSAVTSMMNLATAFAGFGSVPLFFLACGRYGVSKREE